MKSGLRHVQALIESMAEIDRKVQKKIVRKALRAGSKVVAKELRSRVRKRSGALRKSIKVRAGRRAKTKISAVISAGGGITRGGKEVRYIGPEEYGTKFQAPNPFMRPGFKAAERPANDAIVAVMRAEIRAALKSR